MIIKIKRQENKNSAPYFQEFEYTGDLNITVAAVLESFNQYGDLTDTHGEESRLISWECSCSQATCGACAMVINGKPALACETFLYKLKGNVVTLEPLKKFPVVRDLIVDRSIIEKNLITTKAYIDKFEKNNANIKNHDLLYSISKCLKCGLCLEICPNYKAGENFYGPLFANELFLDYSQTANRKGELLKEYKKHFSNSCSNSYACMNICPAKIPTLSSIGKMNRH